MAITLPDQVGLTEEVTCATIKGLENDPSCAACPPSGCPSEVAAGVSTAGRGPRIEASIEAQQSELVGPLTIAFSIRSLRNPYSTKTTDSFQMRLATADGYAIAR